MIPDINFGNRRIENLGSVQKMNTSTGYLHQPVAEPKAMVSNTDAVAYRAGAEAAADIARAASHISLVLDRRDEREAHYALMQADNFVKNGWYGTDSIDQKTGNKVHSPGIADTSWRQMDQNKTDAVKEMDSLKRKVRDQEFYSNLSADQKKKFERAWVLKEDEYNRAASNLNTAHTLTRKREQDQEMVNWNSQKVFDNVGKDDASYGASVRWAVGQNFKIVQGTAILNPEIFDDPNADFTKKEWFDKIEWAGKMTDDEKARKQKMLQNMAVGFDLKRIEALKNATSTNQAFPENQELNTPEKCAAKARVIAAELKSLGMINDQHLNAINADINGAVYDFDRLHKVEIKKNGDALAKEFKDEVLKDCDDTNAFLSKKFDISGYNAKISAMIATGKIDEKTGLSFAQQYAQLAERQTQMQLTIDKGLGVWTKTKRIDGKEIDVFVPYKNGSGKSEVNDFYVTKYRKPTMAGERNIWDDPVQAMDELDFDLKMGNIPIEFYNAEVSKGKMMMKPKAKAAYMEIFGADENFTSAEHKDVTNPAKKKSVWAKNSLWAGNINDGPTWKTDTERGDGGETLVTDGQRKQIYDCLVELTEAGIDPRAAIREIMAPSIGRWRKTELAHRLNPANLRAFQRDILSRGEIDAGIEGQEARTRKAGAEYDRSEEARKRRLDERMRQAYK